MKFSFKTIISALKKSFRLLTFGIFMLIILLSGLWLVRFLYNAFNFLEGEEIKVTLEQKKVNTRLYTEVMEHYEKNTHRPITGLEGRINPFRSDFGEPRESEEPAE